MKMKNFRFSYLFLMIVVVSLMTIGSTYAYWTATTHSGRSDIETESTTYSISMSINGLYEGFSVIPMNDEYALKALSNKCVDKYGRGACAAYTIDVYDYSEDLDYISGYMDLTTNNMENLSYMMLRLSDEFREESCVKIESQVYNDDVPLEEREYDNYCVVREASHMGDGKELSLGDSYDVLGTESVRFILLIWLSNLDVSQNNIDIGSFNAVITMQAGNGGKIKGSISSALIVDDLVGGDSDE